MEYYAGIFICALGGLMLLWVFVRPRKGDEPHCRACRFSLAGLTEPRVCPECGADLTLKRSTIKGHRPNPRPAIAWCIGLALLGSALIGLDRMNRTGFYSLNAHKPAWLLQSEAFLLGDLRASMATDEILDRLSDGKLAPSARDTLLRTALVRHAQTWRAFPDAQWIVITAAIGRGELSFEQIERVWNDCICDASLIEAGRGDQTYFPGESVLFVVGYDTRAGSLIRAGPAESGFPLDQSMSISFANEDGEMITAAKIRSRGPVIQRHANMRPGTSSNYQQLRIVLHEEIGEHQGRIEFEVSCIADMLGATWANADEQQLAKLGSLNHTYSFPIKINIVDPLDLEVPAIDPASIAQTPSSLIDFEVTKATNSFDHSRGAVITFRVRTALRLEKDIGLGGHLFFAQGNRRVGVSLDGCTPHEWSQYFVTLFGYKPGPVDVYYEHDQITAAKARKKAPRVLGGTIDLGTVTLPDPWPEADDNSR